jgi:hypothetical protein
MSGAAPPELTTEKYAAIAAQVEVHKDRPKAEVLAPFGFSEDAWEATVASFTRRIVDEIRERTGSEVPIEHRYPLAAGYAKAYARAVKEARRALADPDDEEPEEMTLRIPPGTPADEPLGLLAASNRAARR